MKKIDDSARYKDTEYWVRKYEVNYVIGITDFSQKVLGEINYVELPEVGTVLKKDDLLGMVESDKSATDIHIPISGKVNAVNTDLLKNPDWINSDPYGNGWLIRIGSVTIEDWNELDDANTYSKSIHLFFNKS